MQIKKSTAVRVPVILTDAVTGDPLTGLLFSDVTVYVQKQDGVSVHKVLINADWFEVDAGNMPGVYDLLLSAADTDTPGFLKYTVTRFLTNTYHGLLEDVTNITSDVMDTLVLTNGALLINAVIDQVVYDASTPPNMISSRIRCYATAAEALAPDINTPVLTLTATDSYGPSGWTGETRTKV